MKVFVSNLPFVATERDLVRLFSAVGKVAEAHIFMRDGLSSGQAVVRFENEKSAEAALTFDRTIYAGRTLKVRRWMGYENLMGAKHRWA